MRYTSKAYPIFAPLCAKGQLMSHAVAMPTDETRRAAEIVERFLVASMVPDPETAARYISPDLRITFTGGRKYGHPRETTAFNAKRYKWVKKKMERTDVVAGKSIVPGAKWKTRSKTTS